MSSLVDIAGQKFGRLTVLDRRGSRKTKNGTVAMWLCQCSCGEQTITRGSSLRAGTAQSCGCKNREETSARLIAFNFRHGQTHTPEYQACQHAKRRCTSPKDRGWKDYGGRGIEFRFHSFEEFFAHVGPRPSPKHSLDRLDNDGHYELENVRWATKQEQMQNRREYATIKRICCADCGSTNFKRINEEKTCAKS